MIRQRLYNPALLSKEELKETFVARQNTLNKLVDHISKHKQGDPCRHVIIVGPRGMGKTTLGLRVLHEIEDRPNLSGTWQPVPFNEESYGIGDAAEFWISTLDHLSHAVNDEVWSEYSKKISASEPDGKALEAYALDALSEYLNESQKRLVLFVENIDILFGQMKSERDFHALRAALMTNSRALLLGTANSAFSGISRYSDPFYGFFHLIRLRGLTGCEAAQLVETIASRSNDSNLGADLPLACGRIEAVRRLTGGNPRSIVMAAQILVEASSKPADVLERVIDEQTPYFKARIEELPVQARKVFSELADGWRPMLARDVAVASRLGTSQASAQLRVLIDRGYVKEVNLAGESRTRYELCDRFFNIYYLYRLSRGKREKLRQFVEFLYDLFGAPSVRIICLESLRIIGTTQYTPSETGELLSTLANKIIRDEELADQEQRISEMLKIIDECDQHSRKVEEKDPPGTSDWVKLGKRLHISGHANDAIQVYIHALGVFILRLGDNDESDWQLVRDIFDQVNFNIDLNQFSALQRLKLGCRIGFIGAYGAVTVKNSLAADALGLALRCGVVEEIGCEEELESNIFLLTALLEMIVREPELGERRQREEIIERLTKIARSDDELLIGGWFRVLMSIVSRMIADGQCDLLGKVFLWTAREFPEKDEGWRLYAVWRLIQIGDKGHANATECVNKALMIGPNDPRNHYIAFVAWAVREEWTKALDHLETCFEFDPKFAKDIRPAFATLLFRAACAGNQGRVNQIIEKANLQNELEPLWYASHPEEDLDALPLPREIVDAAKHIRSKLGNETHREH